MDKNILVKKLNILKQDKDLSVFDQFVNGLYIVKSGGNCNTKIFYE